MTSITPVALLAAQLKRQLDDEVRRRRAASDRSGDAAPSSASAGKPLPGAGLVDLSSIDPTLPDAPLRAFRAYLGSRIRLELGAIDPSDVTLGDVLDRVWAEMQADPALAKAMWAAGRELLDDSTRAG